ncbi:CoA transferase, partial [Streptomyces sp. SID11233]|nr:CoA transferase [Streptomyces sp. SID11233]
FGTLAEAMSGFAAITGEPGGPPVLPPFGLADSIAALATAYAVMTALAGRERTGRGQVVDLAIIEPILTVLGPQPLWYD